jgi:zinc transporter 9
VRLFNPFGNLCSQRESSRGVEAIIKTSDPDGSSGRAESPTTTIAASLLVGFTLMLVTEKLLPGAHFHIPASRPISSSASTVEFDADAELRDVGRSARPCDLHPPAIRTATGDGPTVLVPGKDFAITLGLVLHSLFDGLAIGSSVVANSPSKAFIIQILVIYKGATAIRACCVVSFC